MFFNCWLICIDKHCFCFPAGSQTAATFTVNRFNDSSVSVCLCVSFSSCLFHCFIFTLQNVLFQGIVFLFFFSAAVKTCCLCTKPKGNLAFRKLCDTLLFIHPPAWKIHQLGVFCVVKSAGDEQQKSDGVGLSEQFLWRGIPSTTFFFFSFFFF